MYVLSVETQRGRWETRKRFRDFEARAIPVDSLLLFRTTCRMQLFDRQIRERFSFDTPIPSLPSKHRVRQLHPLYPFPGVPAFRRHTEVSDARLQLKNMEPAFVEQRKVALQCYLDSMLDFPYVVQSESVVWPGIQLRRFRSEPSVQDTAAFNIGVAGGLALPARDCRQAMALSL